MAVASDAGPSEPDSRRGSTTRSGTTSPVSDAGPSRTASRSPSRATTGEAPLEHHLASPIPIARHRAPVAQLTKEDSSGRTRSNPPLAEKRTITAGERAKVDRLDAEIAEVEAEIASIDERERRERESATAREAFERQVGPLGVRGADASEGAFLRNWLLGEGPRSFTVPVHLAAREAELIRQGASPAELRTLLWDTGSSGSLVPTTLSRTLYQYLEASMAVFRMPTSKISTDSGEAMKFPKVDAHGIGTQVIAQGTAIGGTDPTFASTTLDAYKYGQFVQVASEVIQDSVVDIVAFLAANTGRALGRVVGTDLAIGSGTNEPRGVMTALAAAGAGSVTTGGSLITPSYESLIDLQYSVADEYRAAPGVAWLMRDATAGNLRKLRDGAGGTVGAPLWQPSFTAGIQGGQPDRLLGHPAFTDPNVASLASNARIMAYGDFSAYYVRHVGGVVFERSDDFAFSTDLVSLRCKWRVDGDLLDFGAIKSLVQNV